ncbi:antigen 43 domain protein [Escherichia coli 7-233-03_S3_C2]|nr:antigen 43 domain protein [Escherichia coli 7-233-03_S3_C2]
MKAGLQRYNHQRDGYQTVKTGAMATEPSSTPAQKADRMQKIVYGQNVHGHAVRTTINKNGRQIVAAEGTANTTVVYAGGDQTVHGHALNTTLNGGYQYVHTADGADTVINRGAGRLLRQVALPVTPP